MGFIARRLIKENLHGVQVLVNDTENNYFNVVELPTTLSQGRHAFKIFGSEFLKRNVPLKMEILDSFGNTVYISPVDFVGEETPPYLPYRFVTMEVYKPPVNREGIAELTILGEIDPSAVDFQIPSQFQNSYNVKFQQKLNLDLATIVNTQPIRFYKAPFVEASEIVKARLVNTTVTSSVRVFSSASATPRPDIQDIPIVVVTGSQEQEDNEIPQIANPNKDIENFAENFKYKTGLYGPMPSIVSRRGGLPRFASKESAAMSIQIPTGGLTAKMQGAAITIPEHTTTVSFLDGENNLSQSVVTVPKFETTISNIVNDDTFEIDEVPVHNIPEPPPGFVSADGTLPVQVDDFSDVPISMSFEDVVTTVLSSSYQYNSYADLTLKNLRTFSGDVYRVKIHGKMQSQNTGYSVMADTVIESPELLRDTNSPSGWLRTGYFLNTSHLDSYWSASSFDGNTKGANVTASHTGSQYIDSMYLSGSTYGLNETIVAETDPNFTFTLQKGVVYTLSMLIKGKTTQKVFNTAGKSSSQGKLYFHLSGSNLNNSKKLTTNTYVGAELTEPDSDKTVFLELEEDIAGYQDFGRIEHTFTPRFNLDRLRNTDSKLQIRADSGEWHVSDISLRPAMDTGFSPDEYNIILPVPVSNRPDKLDMFIEYFDINSNTVENVTVKENIEIAGAPLVIDNDDNLLTGSLFIGNLQGAGIEMKGGSAYMRSIGYEGFISASVGGEGGFMIWSGSVLPDSPDSYTGAGLEIHDGTTGVNESYFKFRTKPSVFDVKTKTFFLGQTTTAFVSGSNGNIEISSSNFHVSGGIVSASAGHLGNWKIDDGPLKGENITMDAANSTIYKTDQGPGSDSGAAFDRLRDEYYIDFSPEVENPDNFYIKMGPMFMVDKDGILVASGAVFHGSITASAGYIGGFKIGSSSLYYGSEETPNFFISGSAGGGTGVGKTNLFISSSGFQVNYYLIVYFYQFQIHQ